MKTPLVFFALLSAHFLPAQPSDPPLKGDFNGDGKQESVLIHPPLFDSLGKYVGNWGFDLRFSDPSIPAIHFEQWTTGPLMNEGDLDGDGADELSVIPLGDASEWSICILYSLKKNVWKEPIKAVPIWGTGADEEHIRKDPEREGYLLVNAWTEPGKMETRSVKME